MKSQHAATALVLLSVAFFAFSAGFLSGRMTAGDTFTINAELPSSQEAARLSDTHVAADASEEPDLHPSASIPAFPININTCGEEDLMLLPSIGATRAQNIIAFRTEHGPFLSIADIMLVSGIGESIFDRLKDLITVGPPSS